MTEELAGGVGDLTWETALAPMPLVRLADGERAVRVRYRRDDPACDRTFLLLLKAGEELTEAMVDRAIEEHTSNGR